MAQNKKTDFVEAEELPELTEQQYAYVQARLGGKGITDAYREAYDTENMKTNSIYVCASKTEHNAKIALWMAAGRMSHLGSARLTADQHMLELARLREIALRSGNVGAAVQAETVRGKVAGHHVEKVQDVTAINDPVATLKQIATEFGPEMAKELALKNGIEWDSGEATKH